MHNNRIIQIGIIADCNERVDRAFEKALGWHSWGIWETTPGPGRFYMDREEDFICRMSFYSFGALEVEVIQPLRGRSCWQDYLDKTGGGIHHLLFNVDSASDCRNFLTDNGWPTRQQGRARPYGENVIWAYADTYEDLKFTVEYTNRAEFPQTNPAIRPRVEGHLNNLTGARLLCWNAAELKSVYETKLNWKPDNNFIYKLDTMQLFVSDPEGKTWSHFMEVHGEGLASLIIDAENTSSARKHIESSGVAHIYDEDEFSVKYDIGTGFLIELIKHPTF